MIVSNFSAGCSSFAATWILRREIDVILYTHIDDQHPDTMRFLREAEALLGRPITVLQSPFKTVGEVCRHHKYHNGKDGARCTMELKRKVREKWEYENSDGDLVYVWGYDRTEKDRADKMEHIIAPQYGHKFPLIDSDMSKTDAHELCNKLGIKRPAMYDLGYPNNNCIGCVKGSLGYWNKIRADFPEVFEDRAKMEREIGASMMHTKKDGKIYLDELEKHRGRMNAPIEVEECGLFCQMAAL